MMYIYLANGDLKLIENIIKEDFTNNYTSFDYINAFINYYNSNSSNIFNDGNIYKINTILAFNHISIDDNIVTIDIIYKWDCINNNLLSGIDSQRVNFSNDLSYINPNGVFSGTTFIKNGTIQIPSDNDILSFTSIAISPSPIQTNIVSTDTTNPNNFIPTESPLIPTNTMNPNNFIPTETLFIPTDTTNPNNFIPTETLFIPTDTMNPNNFIST